jgi:hypothetical protein
MMVALNTPANKMLAVIGEDAVAVLAKAASRSLYALLVGVLAYFVILDVKRRISFELIKRYLLNWARNAGLRVPRTMDDAAIS